jgi:hypothetical protein
MLMSNTTKKVDTVLEQSLLLLSLLMNGTYERPTPSPNHVLNSSKHSYLLLFIWHFWEALIRSVSHWRMMNIERRKSRMRVRIYVDVVQVQED